MRYAACLAPDIFLLIALLRMTYVGLHSERAAMFIFFCGWLVYSTITLFLGQVWETGSRQYAAAFLALSAIAWLCGTPALMAASERLSHSLWHAGVILLLLMVAALASRFALLNSSLLTIAKCLAINAWVAVIFGAIFLLASIGAQKPDLVLWRCAGSFFLIFGFGYLLIGALRLGAWSYAALILLAGSAWLALALLIGPGHEPIFNFEKLGLTAAALRISVANGEWRVVSKGASHG